MLIAALMCVLFLFLVSTNKPYRDEGDDRTNSVAYVCLVFTLLLGMALKVQQYEASDTAKQDEAMYTALLIIVNVTLVLFALWQMIMDAWAGANAKAEKAKMVGKTIKSRLSRAENDVYLLEEPENGSIESGVQMAKEGSRALPNTTSKASAMLDARLTNQNKMNGMPSAIILDSDSDGAFDD